MPEAPQQTRPQSNPSPPGAPAPAAPQETRAPTQSSPPRKPPFWRRLSRRRLAAVIAGALLLILLAVLYLRPASKEDYASTAYTVKKSDLVISVLEGGSLAATNLQEIKCAVEGQTTILTVVPDGYIITDKDVQNGKMLLELDGSKVREQAIQQDVTYQDAKAAYTQVKEQLEIQKNQNESDISAAELQVKFARMDLEKYFGAELTDAVLADKVDFTALVAGRLSPLEASEFLRKLNLGGAARQNWEKLQSDIDLAGAQFSSEVTTYQWSRKLGPAIAPDVQLIADADKIIADSLGRRWPDDTVKGDGYIQRSEVESGALLLKTRLSAMKQAELSLNLFLQYDFAKQMATFRSAFTEASRQLERTTAKARSALATVEGNLKSREATLKIQEERLDRLNKQVAECTIRATRTGMVVYASSGDPWRRGQNKIEEGAVVRERQVILTIPDPAAMEVTVRVHEASVDKIKPGQQAKVVVEAFPDMTLWGEVQKVARMPETPNWMSPDLKVYSTTLSLKDAPQVLKPGMSAQVEIMVDKVANALLTPIQAVFNYNGQRLCYALDANAPQPRLVETGQFNDKFIEILKGVKEGDRVLLHQPPIPDTVLAKLVPKPKQAQPEVAGAPLPKSEQDPARFLPPATGSDATPGPPGGVNAPDAGAAGTRQPRRGRPAAREGAPASPAARSPAAGEDAGGSR